MLLNTFTYLCFLAVVTAVHYMLPERYRNYFLLVASIYFLWTNGPESLGMAVFIAFVTFFFGRKIASVADKKSAKLWTVAGTVLLVLNLCCFKYANLVTSFLKDPVTVLLPVGLSFYSFTSIGYLIDVYKGMIEPETNAVDWLLSVLFFPHILSGPIAKSGNLLHQLKRRNVTPEMIVEGLRRILIGAMFKVALADGLAVIVNGVYDNLDNHSGLAVLVALFLYPLQLYFDFAGYSSMAVGSALLLGVRLQENFLAPYFSTGIGEIWRRWHITLSEWLRDYIYFPLGGSRKGESRTLINLLIVFTVSALWHGNTLTNIIWSAVIVVSRFLERLFSKNSRGLTGEEAFAAKSWIKRVLVYIWWALAFFPFRMNSVSEMKRVVQMIGEKQNIGTFILEFLNLASAGVSDTGTYYLIYFGSIIVSLAIATWIDFVLYKSTTERGAVPVTDPFESLPEKRRWILYWIMGLAVAAMYIIIQTGGGPSFIYQGY